MQISYKPLWHTLLEKGMSKEDLRTMAKLSTNAIANMGKDKNVSMSTLLKICETLQCDLDAVVELKGLDLIIKHIHQDWCHCFLAAVEWTKDLKMQAILEYGQMTLIKMPKRYLDSI